MKTKLTKELQGKITDLIEAGNYIETSCQACGISKQSYYFWLNRADAFAETGKPKGDQIYLDFSDAVKKAHKVAEVALVGTVKTAAIDSWQAAAWMLERKHPDRFGKRMVVAGDKDRPVKIKVVDNDDE